MIAIQYEYLIRAAFGCGRNIRHGAEADIFRELQRAATHFVNESIDQYKLGIKVGEIKAYLYDAFYEAEEQYKDNVEFQAKMRECKDLLFEPSFDSINECVNKASEAFISVGLTVS